MEEKKRDVRLSPVAATLAEHARNVWVATTERGHFKEDFENPAYWAHIASKLRPWDHIEVRAEDGTFYAEYLVLACDRTWARVRNLSFVSLTDSDVSLSQAEKIIGDYEIRFRGKKRFSVIRRSDNALLQENMHTESDAKKWLEVYLNAQGIPA